MLSSSNVKFSKYIWHANSYKCLMSEVIDYALHDCIDFPDKVNLVTGLHLKQETLIWFKIKKIKIVLKENCLQ